jgi:hypothetical protein
MTRSGHAQDRGYVLLVMWVLLFLVCIPFLAFIAVGTARQYADSKHIGKVRKVRETVRSSMQNVINLLKAEYYVDHYDPSIFDMENFRIDLTVPTRLKYLKFSNFQRDRTQKSIYFTSQMTWEKTGTGNSEIRGYRGDNYMAPGQGIFSLLTFRNDLLRFGLVGDGNLSVQGEVFGGAILNGGAYVQGDMDFSQASVQFSGRPVISGGQMTLGPQVRLLPGTTAYFGGGLLSGGAQVLGPQFRAEPPVDLVVPDLEYYNTEYRFVQGGDATWEFEQVGSECRCRYGPGVDEFWPVEYIPNHGWPVFTLLNGNLTLSGQCSSRATVVSYAPFPSNAQGNIFISGDTGQLSPPGVFSSTSSSFAVMASSGIVFQGGGVQNMFGYYYAQVVSVQPNPGTLANTNATVHGVVHVGQTLRSTSPSNSLAIQFDPDLNVNLPAEFPERPVLVSYQLRK